MTIPIRNNGKQVKKCLIFFAFGDRMIFRIEACKRALRKKHVTAAAVGCFSYREKIGGILMKMKYSRPCVEIVDFAALERIASDARDSRDAREGGSFEGSGKDSVSIVTPAPTVGNEGVGDW